MRIGAPVLSPSKTPETISTWSASWRCVVMALWPGRRRSSSRCTVSRSTTIPGGMPSTSTPTPAPCDSPKVVSVNRRPKVEDISALLRLRPWLRGGLLQGGGVDLRAELQVVRDHRLEVVQVGGADLLARAGDPRLALLPRHDVLARVFEEQFVVQ